MGEFYLDYFDIQTDKIWVVYGVIYTIVVYVVCMALACRVLENKRFEAPTNVAMPRTQNTHPTVAEKEAAFALVSTPKLVQHKTTPNKLKSSGSIDVAILVERSEHYFEPVTLVFEDLWYSVPVPGKKGEFIDLLKGISGGGKMRGTILLSGHEATDLSVRRATGYCEQMDIHVETATIREALVFSAFLRQGSDVSDDAKLDSVQECLELLDFESIADRIVRGCSIEQLKRLMIGVELAAQPSVLFLDEPTSGLDARSAKAIMDGVRKVADTGISGSHGVVYFTQTKFLLQRFMRLYWRSPAYNWSRIAINIFFGRVIWLVFFDLTFESYQGINDGLGMVFMTTSFLGIVAQNSSIPFASQARASFYRERASQTYSSFWYFVGFPLAEIPYVLFATFLYSVIFYPMAGFTGLYRLLVFWLYTSLHVLVMVYIGQFLAFVLPSVEVAALIGMLFSSIFVLFMGSTPPASAIPQVYQWLHAISPPRYTFKLLSAFLLGDCSEPGQVGCQVISNEPNSPPMTVKQFLDAVFEIHHENIAHYACMLLVPLVVVHVLALLALRFINHQKR